MAVNPPPAPCRPAWWAILGLLVCALPLRAADVEPGISAEIDSIELQSRSDPAKALRLVDNLLQSTPVSAPQELRLQGLRGLYLGDLGRHDEVTAEAKVLEKRGMPGAVACAELIRANDFLLSGSVLPARDDAERAYRDLPKNGDPVLRYYTFMLRANIARQQGHFKEALAQYQVAADLMERLHSPFRLLRVHDSMAQLLADVGETDKALWHNTQALEQATLLGDAATLSSTWTTRALILTGKDQEAAEREAVDKAITYARQSGSNDLIATTLTNVADADLKAKDYKAALRDARQAIDACRRVADVTCAAVAEVNAGEATIALGDLPKGKVLIEQALTIYEKSGDKAGVVDLLKEYGDVLERAGDYKGAVAAFHRGDKLSSEIFEGSRKKELLELETRYQTEQKEKQIDLLNRENQLKAAELKNRKLQQWLWLMGAVLLALGLGVIAFLYRRAREANLKLLASNELLKVTSERDPLSGLFNRRYFQEAIRGRVERGALHCGLLLFDIDHFKRINDSAGHAAGDAVIIEVARRIQAATRGSDFVVRWGGEEYLAALAPMPLEQLDKLAERLLQVIAQTPVKYGDSLIPVTVSIGFANFPLSDAHLMIDWERAVNLIDMALYVAKADGRNRACGIVSVAPGGVEVLDAIEADFQHACRDGRVQLKVIEGPPHAATAPIAPVGDS